MPGPGEQHVNNLGQAITNPFEVPKSHISEYTAQEIATLQSRLEKQLGPEFISSRTGPSGQKVHYIAAEKCIGLANQVFGFNGWSSSIRELQVDFVDENPHTSKVSLGLSVIVRVTLKDGTFHEDIGYGHIENCKGKAAAFEKAKKEGTTDALKRALRNFGNVLGNCLYDRDYLAKVTKIKVAPTKWDAEGLHRHSTYVPEKREPVRPALQDGKQNAESRLEPAGFVEDEFGDFDEADFAVGNEDEFSPDEVALSTTASHHAEPPRQNDSSRLYSDQSKTVPALQRKVTNQNLPGVENEDGMALQQRQPQTPNIVPARTGGASAIGQRNGPIEATVMSKLGQVVLPSTGRVLNQPSRTGVSSTTEPLVPHMRKPSETEIQVGLSDVPAPNANMTPAFLSAKALPKDSDGAGNITSLPVGASSAFNPKADSPSIRKTPGIDHSISRPTSKEYKHVPGNAPPNPVNSPARSRGNLVNPQLDATRRIGAPGSPSPLTNRSSYKPPTMMGKRPNDVIQRAARAPLGDIPTNAPIPTSEEGADAKRQKLGSS